MVKRDMYNTHHKYIHIHKVKYMYIHGIYHSWTCTYMYLLGYHWCNSSLGEHMKSSKKGSRCQSCVGADCVLSAFPPSLPPSQVQPARHPCPAVHHVQHPSAPSHQPFCGTCTPRGVTVHQQVSEQHHVATEHRQLTASSAPSMLRESSYAWLLLTCQAANHISVYPCMYIIYAMTYHVQVR